jgi:hypothetical protein
MAIRMERKARMAVVEGMDLKARTNPKTETPARSTRMRTLTCPMNTDRNGESIIQSLRVNLTLNSVPP